MLDHADFVSAIPEIVSAVSAEAKKAGLRVRAYCRQARALFGICFYRGDTVIADVEAEKVSGIGYIYRSSFKEVKFVPGVSFAATRRAVAKLTSLHEREAVIENLAKKLVAGALKSEQYRINRDRSYEEDQKNKILRKEKMSDMCAQLSKQLGTPIETPRYGTTVFLPEARRVSRMLKVDPDSSKFVVSEIRLESAEQLRKLLDLVESPDF